MKEGMHEDIDVERGEGNAICFYLILSHLVALKARHSYMRTVGSQAKDEYLEIDTGQGSILNIEKSLFVSSPRNLTDIVNEQT
jgi:hypothetical protein